MNSTGDNAHRCLTLPLSTPVPRTGCLQRPDDFNQLVVNVVFFRDSPDTIARFLEVDAITKEPLFVLKCFCRQLP